MLLFFGWFSGLLSVVCYVPYIRDILLHKTNPERASWLIWTVLGSIAFFSQLAKGATNSLWLTATQTLGVAIIFFLSLKWGTGGLAKKDYLALFVASLGLALWYFTKEATFALYLIIIVDCAGALLTVYKAYKDPQSETLSTWLLAGISGLFAAFSIGSINIILLSYPVYIFLINITVVLAMLAGYRTNKQFKTTLRKVE